MEFILNSLNYFYVSPTMEFKESVTLFPCNSCVPVTVDPDSSPRGTISKIFLVQLSVTHMACGFEDPQLHEKGLSSVCLWRTAVVFSPTCLLYEISSPLI